MNAEDRLSELMDAATRALNPPLEAMLEEGVRRGRIRRRRRRAAVAGATVAAVLVTAGVAALARNNTDGPRYDVGEAGETSGAPTASTWPSALPASAISAAAGVPTPTPTVLVPIDAAAAAGILKQLVGRDLALVSYSTVETGKGATGSAAMIVEDRQGLAQVVVTVASVKDGVVDPLDCAQQAAQLKASGARPTGAPPVGCTVQTLTGGARVMQEVLGANPYGIYQTRVVVDRVDGVVVEIAAANGILNPPATKYTRTDPPLSVGVWTDVALNPLWQTEVPATLAKGK
jgi:hypothetical protein